LSREEPEPEFFQQAALRYEVGENHTYDFVEGHIPVELDEELGSTASGENKGYFYFEDGDVDSGLTAVLNLDRYIESEGPFDGIMAFSQSVGLAATWLVYRQRRRLPSVRCGIFFSGAATAMDPDILAEGRMVFLQSAKLGEAITIPTAHIYGAEDPYAAAAAEFSALCNSGARSVYVHPGQHEVPGSGSRSSTKDVVNVTVNTMRRVISLSSEQDMLD
jgi:hypothetical protein